MPMRPRTANGKSHLKNTLGFDFTGRMKSIVVDMVDRLPELAHIDLDLVALN